MLIELLTPFTDHTKLSQVGWVKQVVQPSVLDAKYNMFVEELDLSVRTLNSLRRGGITTVGELIAKGEKSLLALRNFGQKSKQEVDERLKAMGLSLTPQDEPETDENQPEE